MLAALLGAMTLGTGLLLVMETSPAFSPSLSLAARTGEVIPIDMALQAVLHTQAPVTQGKWRHIVIHDHYCSDSVDVAAGCHFVIYPDDGRGPDGQILPTARWKDQLDGAHIFLRGLNSSSIGICLVGDTDRQAPTDLQMQSLLRLVRRLQAEHAIPQANVVLHSEFTGARCPGRLFPHAEFRSRLLDVHVQ